MDSESLLASILDELVPPDAERGMPGAGGLGLAASIGEAPGLAPLLALGLAAVRELVSQRGADDFAFLPASERVSVVEELATSQPALLPALLFCVYQAYYQHPTVLEALGMPPRPPYPEGYEQGPNDLSLLDAVRERGPIYREA